MVGFAIIIFNIFILTVVISFMFILAIISLIFIH
jgi:hypothetical protein